MAASCCSALPQVNDAWGAQLHPHKDLIELIFAKASSTRPQAKFLKFGCMDELFFQQGD